MGKMKISQILATSSWKVGNKVQRKDDVVGTITWYFDSSQLKGQGPEVDKWIKPTKVILQVNWPGEGLKLVRDVDVVPYDKPRMRDKGYEKK